MNTPNADHLSQNSEYRVSTRTMQIWRTGAHQANTSRASGASREWESQSMTAIGAVMLSRKHGKRRGGQVVSVRPRKLVLVCGSRDYRRDYYVTDVMEDLLLDEGPYDVLHGDARGADRAALKASESLGVPHTMYRADWERYGKAAGPRRNRQMLDERPNLVLAFCTEIGSDGLPSSPGTRDTVIEAQRRGIEVRIYGVPKERGRRGDTTYLHEANGEVDR